MSDAFDRCFAITVGHEGGQLDLNPNDSGNWTGGSVGYGELRGSKFGISAAAYPSLKISDLTLEQAKNLYFQDYWTPVSGDALPLPLAVLVFDAAVNNGIHRATIWLQVALDVGADGLIGPVTLAAAHNRGVDACPAFLAQRIYFMAGLPAWHDFGLGWSRRLAALPYQSMTP